MKKPKKTKRTKKQVKTVFPPRSNYLVGVVMTKTDAAGNNGITLCLMDIASEGQVKAEGTALREAMSRNPGHGVIIIKSLAIEK